MYFVFVVLTTIGLPIASTMWEAVGQPAPDIAAIALKWFVVWGVGIRLGVAGLRQVLRPGFTAREIFKLEGVEALPIVRELGISNLAAGIVALLSLVQPSFALPIAIWAALFYAAAGLGHVRERHRSFKESVAMVTDLFMSVALAAAIVATVTGHR